MACSHRFPKLKYKRVTVILLINEHLLKTYFVPIIVIPEKSLTAETSPCSYPI